MYSVDPDKDPEAGGALCYARLSYQTINKLWSSHKKVWRKLKKWPYQKSIFGKKVVRQKPFLAKKNGPATAEPEVPPMAALYAGSWLGTKPLTFFQK